MRIKNVSWRNFASYGNKTQTLNFEESANFFLVVGANGSGKSSLSDVIKFGLYGKVGSKRIGDIPNRFNQTTYVKIEIENNGSNIEIERGIAPAFVKLTIDNQEYDQAGKKNVDLYIEEEILGLPFYVFNNIISLSINDFKSFLKMSPNDKRMIVDKIFDLGLINTIKNLIKDEIKQTKDNIFLLGKETEILKNQIASSSNELLKLKEELSEDIEEKKSELIENINDYSEKLNLVKLKIEDLKTKETKVNSKIRELNEIHTHNSHIQKTIKEKKDLYSNNKCPMCESDLTTDFHKQVFQEYIEKDKKVKESIAAINESLKKIRNIRTNINQSLVTFEKQRTEFNVFLHDVKNTLLSLNKTKNSSKEVSYIKKIIKNAECTEKKTNKNTDVQENKKNFFKIVDEIFGDKGIKQLAIQKILPTLNAEIQRVLSDLSLDYRVVFNSEFEPKILHLGYEVSAQQLSTGERKKIDFAILIALIRLLKIKYHGLNLIFLDEIFSSLDPDSIHHVLDVLSSITKDLNMNIFVINHTILPTEIFDYKISVTKDTNFSHIEITKIE